MKLLVLFTYLFLIMFPSEDGNMMTNRTTRKKIDNVVTSVIHSESFTLQPLVLPLDSIFANDGHAGNGSFYRILQAEESKGILYAGSAKGRYDWFDFIVIFNRELLIEKVEIIVYREDHGLEITNKAWLAQFRGKTGCETQYGKDVDAVSGATLSANSLVEAIRNACWDLRDNGYVK